MKLPRISRRRFLHGLCVAAPVAAAVDAFWLEPEWLKIRHVRLGQPPTLRLVHFTDVHFKGDRAYLESVVKKINGLTPDLACFTGDIVEKAGFLPGALEILREIKSPLYGVPGNHDYWSGADFESIGRCFAATGGAWLVNDAKAAASGNVHVTGWAKKDAFQPCPASGLKNVLLMHYPVWADALGSRRFDLILAGHSHGGQVRLPLIGPLVVPFDTGRYDLGLFPTPAGPLYVGAGIGTFSVKIRFHCRPEITLIEV